jgi:hypothetical protein
MYKLTRQLSIEDFIFPYGKLSAKNRWVKMADLIDWDDVERVYAAGFVNNGAPAHPARLALGSLIIKQVLDCSDEELCLQVAENPYLQFFIGQKGFSESCPFGASTLVAFRKRFSDTEIARINEKMLADAKGRKRDSDDGTGDSKKRDDSGDGICDAKALSGTDKGSDTPSVKRTLTLDASVAPANITYPQDVKLLNCARKHLERIIDDICVITGVKKPRMYRNKARKDYLDWSKSKRRTYKKTRTALRRQLGYIRRDLGYIQMLSDQYSPDLKDRQMELLETIGVLYDQQLHMYENRTHTVKDRIVSIEQPFIRPIMRGKTKAPVEFGAKIHISCDDGGYARIEKLSFDAFSEAKDLIECADSYRKRQSCYPGRILADKTYRNRENLAWCKARGIRLSGPRLGRPPTDTNLTRAAKRQERRDAADRNIVEGVFGTTKTTYGLDPVMARTKETTKTVISLAILVFNMKKLLVSSLADICMVLKRVVKGVIWALSGRWLSRVPVMCAVME